ncbi:hypothetical protein [Microbacterium sp. RURRCA19A]|uniref:hypothetical protein n=1 Tax=Microbacterium sp. RURRCA19A TaxID=1907391 RepID=UPI0009565792|nr:hypothetical protein [Microbacterium sp. RURRCA19A]SIS17820.1 hypothetical protein SAMN05880568_3296 [Microbacterium sp. RURRCA19A]
MARELDPLAGASAADALAEQIALQRVDEAGATPQPNSVAKLWVSPEYDELTSEQHDLFEALGVEQSRQATIEAAGLALAATADQWLVEGQRVVVETVKATYVTVLAVLTPYRRRPPIAKRWHLLAKAAFLVGDIAGIATAAIWLGEIPAIAVIMALSAAAATVTAGLSGSEVRDVRDCIRRAVLLPDLPDALLPYRHLFEAPERAWPYVKALLWVSVSVAATVACAIFALRASIEDPLVGLVFGGIAAAIAAASWIESFCYADAVADLIDNADADYTREVAKHQELAASAALQRHNEALATATSIQAEQSHRGDAAGHHMQALLYGILRRNPQTAGNGPAAEPTTIGQTTRRGGTK